MKKKVFITGMGGFTSRYLQTELKNLGYEIYGTVFHSSESKNEFYVDINDKQSVDRVIDTVKPDILVHLAGVSFVPHEDVSEIYRTHIIGTLNLLKSLVNCSKTPDKILLASSSQVYGASNNTNPIDELTPADPMNDYAVSKLAMEQMAHLWIDKLPIIIVRPFNYTGVGQSSNFLLPKIVQHFIRGEKTIELGNIDFERDFSDVRTIVKYYMGLIHSDISGEIFNLCSGTTYFLRNIISMMEEIAGYEININFNPSFARKIEAKYLCGSNTKLLNAIGHIKSITLKDTLRWMYQEGCDDENRN